MFQLKRIWDFPDKTFMEFLFHKNQEVLQVWIKIKVVIHGKPCLAYVGNL